MSENSIETKTLCIDNNAKYSSAELECMDKLLDLVKDVYKVVRHETMGFSIGSTMTDKEFEERSIEIKKTIEELKGNFDKKIRFYN